jgi:hypothetical protein
VRSSILILSLSSILAMVATPGMATDALPPIADVRVGSNKEIRVNAQPFFPLMAWCQSSSRFPLLRSLGFNTFCVNYGGQPSASNFCNAARAVGGYAIPLFDAQAKGHPSLLAYIHGDEPDLGFRTGDPKRSAESVLADYTAWKQLDNTRPVLLNLTAAFMEGPSWAAGKTLEQKQAYYSVVVRGADIASFDVYPTYGWNCPDKLFWVADGVAQLGAYAGRQRPVFAFIETGKGSQWTAYEKQYDVTPEMMRSEVWMAIIRGATGIGYFTHAWQPTVTEFAPTPEMQAELQRLNGQITRLTSAILAPASTREVSISFTNAIQGDVMARESGGCVYVFANNLDMARQAGTATIRISGLVQGSTIEVVDEARQITADKDTFIDQFAPLAVHIYRLGMTYRPNPPTNLRVAP